MGGATRVIFPTRWHAKFLKANLWTGSLENGEKGGRKIEPTADLREERSHFLPNTRTWASLADFSSALFPIEALVHYPSRQTLWKESTRPSTQAFSYRSLDLARNVTSPTDHSFGDVTTFRAKLSELEENAWVLGWKVPKFSFPASGSSAIAVKLR